MTRRKPKTFYNEAPTRRELTLTDEQLVVVDEAEGALAAEAANHVDAHSALTHSGDFSALVDV